MAEEKKAKVKLAPIERHYATKEALDAAQKKATGELKYPKKKARKFKVVGNGKTLFVLASSPKDAVARSRTQLGIAVEELDPSKDGGPVTFEGILGSIAGLTPDQLAKVQAELAELKKAKK